MEGFEVSAQRNTTAEMVVSRQAQEVQAAMVIAKKFPRNEVDSYNRIMRSCQRKSLAEQSMYEYPKGGTKVTGPSIRLAEAMAQNWGNISVPHVRETKKGNVELTDPREIYEMVANQGARWLRACILGIIPGDVQDAALEQCRETLAKGEKEPLIDRVRKMAKAFEDAYSITLPMIEKYLGCNSEEFSENDFIRLKNVYKSLREGMAKREDYFEIAVPAGQKEAIKEKQEGLQES